MKIHINDANILIDLVHLDLVEPFLSLKFELYTTDFVFAELELLQQQVFDSDQLTKLSASVEDMLAIFNLSQEHVGLSFEDCSVWYFAKNMNGILITGDGKLRTKAKASGIGVKGIIYIIEQIKEQNLLTVSVCIEKLQTLLQINNRLPVNEIEKRIQLWKNEINH
ncbi:PIN domain-containing protein [Flavobacterium laiguense]|uniref:PIN domain-containing protein n=1 Tax=Flavobacterium laiguense TaxID=2169409 RepID=A0A2U1JWJ9_9FLAO|nr:hypothetical protein [Flavobacterium laiguense]PWA09502.1 hypothetical protein DB891_07410 [Flavobacterium laiguense]